METKQKIYIFLGIIAVVGVIAGIWFMTLGSEYYSSEIPPSTLKSFLEFFIIRGDTTYSANSTTNVTLEIGSAHLNVSTTVDSFGTPLLNLSTYLPFAKENSTRVQDWSKSRLSFNVTGANTSATTNSLYGNYIKFDGIDDRIVLANNAIYNHGVYTYSLWTRVDGNQAGAFGAWVVGKQDGTFSELRYNIALYYNNPDGTPNGYGCAAWANTDPIGQLANASAVTQGTWHHVVCVRNATEMQIWQDGVLGERHVLDLGADPANDDPFFLGAFPNGADPFNGSVDEFMYFPQTMLNSSQIQSIYQNQSKRFNSGQMIFYNQNLNNTGKINVSLNNYESLMNSNLTFKVNNLNVVNFTKGNVSDYDISSLSSSDKANANITIGLIPSTGGFYSSLAIGNITWLTFGSGSVSPVSISISSPVNYQNYSANITSLSYTINGDYQSCWYSLNNGVTNSSVTCGNTINGLNSSEGSNTWTIYANDTNGLQNKTNVTFRVDTIKPGLTINFPLNTSYNNNTQLPLNFNVTSSEQCLYVNYTLNIYNISCINTDTLLLKRNSTVSPYFFMQQSTNRPRFLAGISTIYTFQDNWNVSPNNALYVRTNFTNYSNYFVAQNFSHTRGWVEFADNDTGTMYDPVPFVRTGPGNGLDGKSKYNLTYYNDTYFTGRILNRTLDFQSKGITVTVMLFEGYGAQFYGVPYGLYHPFNASNNIQGVGYTGAITGLFDCTNTGYASYYPYFRMYAEHMIDVLVDGGARNVIIETINEAGGASNCFQENMTTHLYNYMLNKSVQYPLARSYGFNGGTDAQMYSSFRADMVSPGEGGTTNYEYNHTAGKIIFRDTDHLGGCYSPPSDDVWLSFARGNNYQYLDQWYISNPSLNTCFSTTIRNQISDVVNYARKSDLYNLLPVNNTGLCSTSPYCLMRNASQYIAVRQSGGTNFTVYLQAGNYTFEIFNPSTRAVTVTGTRNITTNTTAQFNATTGGFMVLWINKTSNYGNAVCGNRFVEVAEQCDDGNTNSGDGCSSTCQVENQFYGSSVCQYIPMSSTQGLAWNATNSSLATGEYYFNVTAWDLVGNSNSSIVYLSVVSGAVNACTITGGANFVINGINCAYIGEAISLYPYNLTLRGGANISLFGGTNLTIDALHHLGIGNRVYVNRSNIWFR